MSDEPKKPVDFLLAALFDRAPGPPAIAFTIAAIMLLIAVPLYCLSLDPGGDLERLRMACAACGFIALSVGLWQLRNRLRARQP
jgi:hypothetical protein